MQSVYFPIIIIKNHGRVCLDIKGYKDALIISFTTILPNITTSHKVEKVCSTSSNLHKGSPTKIWSPFDVSYRRICGIGMKWRVLKSEQDFFFVVYKVS